MNHDHSFFKDNCGSATLMFLILSFVFVGLLAFVIDLAHVQNAKTELSNAADAAALAGARALMPMTGEGEPPWPMKNPPPCEEAVQAAMDTSVLNYIDTGPKQKNISLNSAEVITGSWDFKSREFTTVACGSNTNAVKVTARASGDLPQGPVNMTLATIFGVDTMTPSSSAIAAIGYLQTLPRDSNGGFLAMDHDYLERAWELTKEGTVSPPLRFYLVLGPALGQSSYEYADNGSFALPSGEYQAFNPTASEYIANGTQTDVPIAHSVDLKNGEMSNLIKNLQDKITSEGGALDSAVYGVYSQSEGASVGDAWNEKSTPVDSFWTVRLTDAWKATEINKDPKAQEVANNMFPDLNDQKQIVGLIEFEITAKEAYGGPGGDGLPSNTYGIMVKLVK